MKVKFDEKKYKQEFDKKNYRRLSVKFPKNEWDILDDFKLKCTENNTDMSSITKELVKKYIKTL